MNNNLRPTHMKTPQKRNYTFIMIVLEFLYPLQRSALNIAMFIKRKTPVRDICFLYLCVSSRQGVLSP